MNCESLVAVVFPDELTFIGYEAFQDCSSLVSLTLPYKVRRVSDNAFLNCKNLNYLLVPETCIVRYKTLPTSCRLFFY